MGELPEQLQANLNLLDRLNAQLAQSQLSLRTAQVGLGWTPLFGQPEGSGKL